MTACFGHVTLLGRSRSRPQWVSPRGRGRVGAPGVERPWIHQREPWMPCARPRHACDGHGVRQASGRVDTDPLPTWWRPIVAYFSRSTAARRPCTWLRRRLWRRIALWPHSWRFWPERCTDRRTGGERWEEATASSMRGCAARDDRGWGHAARGEGVGAWRPILSNPDFLHYVMLPSHQRCRAFLASLRPHRHRRGKIFSLSLARRDWPAYRAGRAPSAARRSPLGRDPRVVMLSAMVRDAALRGAR